MKPKTIGFRVCSVLVCAFLLATAAFAADSVKFGIQNGDKLTFAGSDEPIVWNVVLSDKTNTDDESGMQLLADNLMGTAENTTSTTSGLKAAFTACYNKGFSDLQKSATLRVTKKDAPKKLTVLRYGVQPVSVWCDGALNGEVLFALSYEEASQIPMASSPPKALGGSARLATFRMTATPMLRQMVSCPLQGTLPPVRSVRRSTSKRRLSMCIRLPVKRRFFCRLRLPKAQTHLPPLRITRRHGN